MAEAQPGTNPELGYNALCNYRIERKIGKGQFSEVYRAVCHLDNKLVALKKVKVNDKPGLYLVFQICIKIYITYKLVIFSAVSLIVTRFVYFLCI